MASHRGFWVDLSGKIGPPVFAATLVACLLERSFDPMHLALLGVGVALIAGSHWREFHRVE
jgi:hypothetical protein